MVRGESAGNIWLKGIGMNVVFLLLLVFVADTRTFALGALVIVLPTVAGIWLRRRRSRTKISTPHSWITGYSAVGNSAVDMV
jgi:hypothetical protein